MSFDSPADLPDWCNECDHCVEGDLLPNGCCPYCGNIIREPDVPVYFTAAPIDYDYGHTTEIIADTGYRHSGGCDTDKPIRMVSITDDYHAGIQKDRNLSGLHPLLSSDEFSEWVRDGLLVEVKNA